MLTMPMVPRGLGPSGVASGAVAIALHALPHHSRDETSEQSRCRKSFALSDVVGFSSLPDSSQCIRSPIRLSTYNATEMITIASND
eukprot:5587314-Amphidinium_carterae.1